jgi:hypothetical protein
VHVLLAGGQQVGKTVENAAHAIEILNAAAIPIRSALPELLLTVAVPPLKAHVLVEEYAPFIAIGVDANDLEALALKARNV